MSQSFSEIHRERLNPTHLTIVKKTDATKRIPQQDLRSLFWSLGGRFLAYRDQSQSIVDIYDREKQSVNRIELTNEKMRRSYSQVAWSTDTTKLLVTDDDRIDVYSASGSTLLHSFKFDLFLGNVLSAAWTADDRIAIAIDTMTYFFSVDGRLLDTWEIAVGSWNRAGTHWVSRGTVGALESPTPMHRFELDENIPGPLWVGDASKLAIKRKNEIEFFDLDGFKCTGKQVSLREPRLSYYNINCLCDSGLNGTLVSQSGGPGDVYLHRFPQEKATTKADLAREITALAAGPKGHIAAVAFRADASGDAAIAILDQDCQSTRTLQSGKSSIAALAWDPSGERVAALDRKGILRIWDLKTGDVQFSFQLNDTVSKDPAIDLGGPGWQLWWSPSGEYLASSCSYTKSTTHQRQDTVYIVKLEPLQLEKVQPFHRGLGWLPTSEFAMKRASNSPDSQGIYFSIFEHQRDYSERRPTIAIFNLHDGSVRHLAELPLPPVEYPPPVLSQNEVVYLGRDEMKRKQTIAQRISLAGGRGETPIFARAEDILRFLIDEGANRIFTIDRTNYLRVVDESEFQTLHSISVQNADFALIDYRNGILWLAEGQSVRRFNGTPINLGSAAAPVKRFQRGWTWLMSLLSSSLLISGLSFLPWWLSSKEASQVLSRIQRWLIIFGAIVSGVLGIWIFSSEALNLFRPDLNYGNNWFRVFELVSLITMSVGLTNYIRLAILRRWPLELLLLLLHVMPFLILTAYRLWPELNENLGQRFPAPALLSLGILFPFFAVGFEHTWLKAKEKKIVIRKRDRKSNLIYSLPSVLFSSTMLLLLAVAMWMPILNYRFLVVQPDWPIFVRTRIVVTLFFIGNSLFLLLYFWNAFTRKQDEFKTPLSREIASPSDGTSNAA